MKEISVQIKTGNIILDGDLVSPALSRGVIIFVSATDLILSENSLEGLPLGYFGASTGAGAALAAAGVRNKFIKAISFPRRQA